jgi:hypothetical protein
MRVSGLVASAVIASFVLLALPPAARAGDPYRECMTTAHGRSVIKFESFERVHRGVHTNYLCVAVKKQGSTTMGPGIVAIISSEGKTVWRERFKQWIDTVRVVPLHEVIKDFGIRQKLEGETKGWPFIVIREEGIGAKEAGRWVLCPWDKTKYYKWIDYEGGGSVMEPKQIKNKSRQIKDAILRLLPDLG